MEEDDNRYTQKMVKLFEAASNGALGDGIGRLTFSRLQVLKSTKTSLRCKLIIPDYLADDDGNWHVGAIATLVDNIGAMTAINFAASHLQASLDFNISYFSTARIHEEVEIEANVIGGYTGKLTHVLVEVKRAVNGELIAAGWIVSNTLRYKCNSSSPTFRNAFLTTMISGILSCICVEKL
ncbi:hypothetical protein ACFE04_008499 [Oxalis oulophora]